MNNFRWRGECYGCKLGRHEKAPVKEVSPQELEAHNRKIKERADREAEERKKMAEWQAEEKERIWREDEIDSQRF